MCLVKSTEVKTHFGLVDNQNKTTARNRLILTHRATEALTPNRNISCHSFPLY